MTMEGFSAGAAGRARSLIVRSADLDGPDNAAVGRLVEAYLTQTESEKAAHLGEGHDAKAHGLPERYRDEVADPRRAYADSAVWVAESNGSSVGLVIVQQNEAVREIKRLWVDPGARGLWDDRPRLLCMQLAPLRAADLDE
jgi:hypothetical protein